MTQRADHDDVVRAALDRVPTPEHEFGFWHELDRRLDHLPPSPIGLQSPLGTQDHMAPGREITTAPATLAILEARPAKGRARPPRWLLVAAAVVIVASVAGAIGAIGGSDKGDVHVGTQPPSPTSTSVPPATATAQDAALAWLDKMAAGDLRSAWDALGPTAKDAWPSFDAFAAARSSFSEGIASWATADGRQAGTVAVGPAGQPAFYVTTITGVRHAEGTTEDGAIAIIVRDEGAGRHTIEPFSPAGSAGLQLTAPASAAHAPSVDRSAPVTATAPTDTARLQFVLDRDTAVVEPTQNRAGQAQYAPPQGWSPGRHVVTAVLVSGTGAPMATAVVFQVA